MTNEEIKKAGEVMIAAANGAHIETRSREGDIWTDLRVQPTWDWKVFDYRIKPTKTFRPWNPEEVPVDAWFTIGYGHGWCFKAVEFNSATGVIKHVDGEAWTPSQALESNLQHSIDGGKTWKPCGVEVES